MHAPTGLCPAFPLHSPGGAFSTLETVSETLVHCLQAAGLPEINYFLSSPALLLFAFGLCQWQVVEPGLSGTPGARCSCIPASCLPGDGAGPAVEGGPDVTLVVMS